MLPLHRSLKWFALAALCTASAQGAENDKIWDALRDPLYLNSLAKHPERLAGGVADTGAVSVNHAYEQGERKDYFIEQQRYGGDWAQAALLTGNDALLQKARKVLDWGFGKEADDGTFPGTGDPLHSTSFFVEAAARSVFVAEHVKGNTPDWMADWRPKILASAKWMAAPATHDRYYKQALAPFTHRFFLHATALAYTAKITGDKDLAATAEKYAREGISRLTPDGILPERDGFDVNYQTISVLFMNRYLLACEDPDLRQQLIKTIKAAYPQLAKRFGPDGIVDRSDSSRSNENGRNGKPKTYDYKNAVQAFLMAAASTGETGYHDLAERIVKGQKWQAE